MEKINSGDNLALKKALNIGNIVIGVRPVLHEGNKYYLQVFLTDCLYKS